MPVRGPLEYPQFQPFAEWDGPNQGERLLLALFARAGSDGRINWLVIGWPDAEG